MKNIEKLFREVFGMDKVDKVRIAKTTTLNINKKDSDVILAEDGTTNTILGLLAKGDMNCAGRAISDTLFGEEDENGEHTTTITLDPNATTGTSVASQTTTTGPAPAATQTATTGTTAVVEEEEKEEEDEKEPERPKDTKISRWFGSLKKFGRSLVEPDVNE